MGFHQPIERAAGEAGIAGGRRHITRVTREQVVEVLLLEPRDMFGTLREVAGRGGRAAGSRHHLIGEIIHTGHG